MIRSLPALILAAHACTTAALADEEEVELTDSGATVVYESSFFEQYRPITALDMLRWIPGTADIVPQDGSGGGGNQQRGFGSGGDQILINGKRLSGKSNNISSALARIQAEAVIRVEVIRGTAEGLDVRSDGLLINVVVDATTDTGSGSWQVHAGDYSGSGVLYDGLISYSRGFGRFAFLVSVELGPYNRADYELREDVFEPTDPNVPAQTFDRSVPRKQSNERYNASGSWQINDTDDLNLNGQFIDADEFEEQSITLVTEGVPGSEEAVDVRTEIGTEWELGGDMTNSFGPGQLKTRAIVTREDEVEDDRFSLVTVSPDSDVVSTLVSTDEKQGETIVRSSYTWPVAAGQKLELGLEAAVNTLDKTTRLFEEQSDGTVVEIPLFNASASVEEERYEAFLTHFWTISERTVLESALNTEWSTIEQDGEDIQLERSFEFLKPRFDFRYDITEQNQFRARLERTVSQLDFSNFVVEFDRDDDLIFGGNPNLVPEKAWETRLTYEHRIGNDRGVLTGIAFYNAIEDHIDRVEVLPGLSAPGNIGDAKAYGVELRSSLRLDPVGINGAVVDVVYVYQQTEATDPFTGEKRRISFEPDHDVEVQFRHDIPAWRFNYVVDFNWRSERYANDINFRDVNTDESPRINITAQLQLRRALTLYGQVRNLNSIDRQRIRERYAGNIADGNLERIETRFRSFQRELIVGFRGQF